jgi:two-component system OmpR family sensor kinase
LESERTFATSAAHELRTPVASALAQVQRMRAETADAEAGRLIVIEEALKRLTRLVERLLQLARADAGIGLNDRPQDIQGLLDIVLDDSRRNPARAHRLTVDLPHGPVLSPIDPDAFAIVVGNLIDNAFQHAPPATPITVEMLADGRVTVTNEGAVIAPTDLAGLKKRFQRGAGSGNGFGLGLYIAETIAQQMGGNLTLHSPPPDRISGFQAVFQAPGPTCQSLA